jgi:hypothetical protein
VLRYQARVPCACDQMAPLRGADQIAVLPTHTQICGAVRVTCGSTRILGFISHRGPSLGPVEPVFILPALMPVFIFMACLPLVCMWCRPWQHLWKYCCSIKKAKGLPALRSPRGAKERRPGRSACKGLIMQRSAAVHARATPGHRGADRTLRRVSAGVSGVSGVIGVITACMKIDTTLLKPISFSSYSYLPFGCVSQK